MFGRDEETLAGVVGALLVAAGETLSTAESCTGGMIGALLTDVAGSSRYYCGGVVAYANEAKVNLLGVAPTLLAEHGAVSAPVARAMAEGATRSFGTDYGIAVTGIAGPDGGTAQKPVGLVYIGLQAPDSGKVGEYRFGADSPREAIRIRAARMALDVLRRHMLRGSAGDASGGGR